MGQTETLRRSERLVNKSKVFYGEVNNRWRWPMEGRRDLNPGPDIIVTSQSSPRVLLQSGLPSAEIAMTVARQSMRGRARHNHHLYKSRLLENQNHQKLKVSVIKYKM